MLDEKQILTCAGEDGHFQPAKLTRHKLRVLKFVQFLGKRARGKGVMILGEPFKAFAGK
jgi:hypothetical protein